MELKKHPAAESEYWEVIESLGGFIWSISHAMSHGNIDDKDGEVTKDIVEARKTQECLLTEICQKFGVIAPKDCPKTEAERTSVPAPEGKIYYWDWYKKMKEDSYLKDYEAMICSACPFSGGLQEMIDCGGSVPCNAFSGIMNRLSIPYECGMLYDHWRREDLYKKIVQKSGEEILLKFQAKEKELEERFSKVS